jgi:CelD/BcsL family acetyltransferase involved in cellulose biosynthesis
LAAEKLARDVRTGLVQSRIIDIRSISDEDEKAWRDLAERAVEPNPFYEPDCLIPAARHQSFGCEIQLVVAHEGDRFIAAVPVRHVRRWRSVPYPMVTTQVRRMTYLGTPLVDEERGVEAVKGLLQALLERRQARRSRVLVVQDMTDGRVAEMFRTATREMKLPLVVFESFERGFLTRRDPPAHTQAHSPRTLRNLRRKQRNLGKELGGTAEVVDRGRDAGAIDDYIVLEASGYKAEFGVAMTTVEGEPDYFREMCSRFASDGRLHLLTLTDGKTTAAMVVWVRAGDTLFQFKWSYDEAYAKYSPGLIVHTEAMRIFEEDTDAQFVDTCTWGENEMINHLYPDRRRIVSCFVVLGSSLVDRAVVRSFIALRPLHRKVYELLRRDKAEQAERGKRAPGSRTSDATVAETEN